ncbi:MAG: hypothetical protein IJN91_03310 [Alphaproteobacteria bacterium]|nr:hypothetical protein [Alphaproteobacteria bacterium]
MKKLTAGIFTVLMGLVSVNAADAAVASKGYVDAVVKTKANTADVYTKDEANNLLSGKADKATTLEGYGITDAYTKTETDQKFDTIVNVDKKIEDLSKLFDVSTGEDGEQTSGLLTTVSGHATRISNLETTTSEQGEKITALETLTGETGQIAQNITKALTDAKAYTDEKVGALTGENGAITTLQNLVGTTSVESQINTKISALDLDNTYETKGAAATALNDAKADATEKANTAEANAKTYAKTYTDQKVSGLNLQDIARVPAACSDADNYCTLTTNGTQFVWEVIARDPAEATEQPSTDADAERLIVTPKTIVEPTVTQ